MITAGLVSFLIIGTTGVAGILLSEYLRQKKHITNETARKMVHMLHAGAITLWAYYLQTYTPIILAELGTLVLVLLAHQLKLFTGLNKVGRVSYGDLLLPISVIIVALLNPSYSQFVVIMAHAGLADALAALVGKKIRSPRYRPFGQTKTLAGTSAFFVTSVIIFVVYLVLGPGLYAAAVPGLLAASAIVTAIEASALYGADNLTIPLATYLVLAIGFV